MQCSDCQFFELNKDHGITIPGAGYCRREPPNCELKANAAGIWPVVQLFDWCGEYVKKAGSP